MSHKNVDKDGVLLMTNNDILGDEIPGDQQEELRRFCNKSLNPNGEVRGNCSLFPGSHPVSLNSDKL